MSRRAWLPHPPRTVRRPLACPTLLPRFASSWLALGTAVRATTPAGMRPVRCVQCDGGWHLQQPEHPPPDPAR